MAAHFGLHPETLGGYERGETIPDHGLLARYKHEFSVSLDWLITGEGAMLPSAQATSIGAGVEMNRLSRAISVVERGLEEAGRRLNPDAKAEVIIAAYEILSEQTEAAVSNVLRLVKA